VIGNGSWDTIRSDAMVVLKNGNIGISTPEFPLHVASNSDCDPASGGHLVTGSAGATNICIDNNEIMVINGGATATLYLNHDGGITEVGGGRAGSGFHRPGGRSARSDACDLRR
jgi:hypothetical protein